MVPVQFRRAKTFFRRNRILGQAAFEQLEPRKLLSINELPYRLEFDQPGRGIADRDGTGTGFDLVLPNRAGDAYQRQLIDLKMRPGVLHLTSRGNSTAGSNYGADNSLTNALGVRFDGSRQVFHASTQIKGPLAYLDRAFEQGGVWFGPDQDRYVKMVFAHDGTRASLQFLVETRGASLGDFPLGPNGTTLHLKNPSQVQTLDLAISADPISGQVAGFYRINAGPMLQMPQVWTMPSNLRSQWFSAESRAGIMAAHKNDAGPITVTFERFAVETGAVEVSRPRITGARPFNNETGVNRDTFVAADVGLISQGRGIDTSTVNSRNVRLIRASDGFEVPATVNTSGGGDAVVLQPLRPLDASTRYTFEITNGLRDQDGRPFSPFQSSFTTNNLQVNVDHSIRFEKVDLYGASGQNFTGVTIGPDNRLYATTSIGTIYRYDIKADGTLVGRRIIRTVPNAMGEARIVTGITFDPASERSNPVAYLTHSQYAFEDAGDWTGRVSRLSGPDLSVYNDLVINLPRSVRDHMTNQPVFGPDGKLYFAQASNTAMGAPDSAWGNRAERLLSGAVLVLDTSAMNRRLRAGLGPINAKTEGSGTFNPYERSSPLAIHATGVRNAYDLLFHSNGKTYAPNNGSAAGGNSPAGPGVTALNTVSQTQSDHLYLIERNGYYGHPNAKRGEFVLYGGNPTAGVDPLEVAAYPVGTAPQASWVAPAYQFGRNFSPNGIIEYRSNAFSGKLKGKILVTRYSGGDDIQVLIPDRNGQIVGSQHGIEGFNRFVDPLDLVEDTRNGNIYVAEFGGQKLTLLRPVETYAPASLSAPASEPVYTAAGLAPKIVPSRVRMAFNDVRGDGKGSINQRIRLNSRGTKSLSLPTDALTISGPDASMFSFDQVPNLPTRIGVNSWRDVRVKFTAPAGTSPGIKTATLTIKSDDPDTPEFQVALRGLATVGEGGANEPSLQRVLDLWQIPIPVGDPNPDDTFLPVPPQGPSDEVVAPVFVRSSRSAPPSVEILGMFGVNTQPVVRFGTYEPGTGGLKRELFTINSAEAQTVNATIQGGGQFDPGMNTPFGLYTVWPGFTNSDGSIREVFSEDALNTWESNVNARRKFRFYPLKNPDGSVRRNTYVFAVEEFTAAYDYQDIVGIIRNVTPVGSGPEIGVENPDVIPRADRLVFAKIQNPNTIFNPGDPPYVNSFRGTNKLRIRNTGDQVLNITSLQTTGNFSIDSPPTLPRAINPGQVLELTVRFTANSGRFVHTGTLVIGSNDPDEPTKTVELAGWWQSKPENNEEPTLHQMIQLMGYTTTITFPGENLSDNGRLRTRGEEVLSAYWVRADPGQPVEVRQVAAYHQQTFPGQIFWHRKGNESLTRITISEDREAQTMLPRQDNQSTLALGRFNPTTAFGFKVDSEWSDPALNRRDQGNQDEGHHMRFYPVRDAQGNVVPNLWFMGMDFLSINYDFNDNVYLISNIRPENRLGAPNSLVPLSIPQGMYLNWADSVESAFSGFNVYRASSASGPFTKLNSSLITVSEFLDTSAPLGEDLYYRVTTVNTGGLESTANGILTRRT